MVFNVIITKSAEVLLRLCYTLLQYRATEVLRMTGLMVSHLGISRVFVEVFRTDLSMGD